MAKIDYRITDVRELPSVDPERVGMFDMMVSWVEDNMRPYSLRLPKEKYTPEEATKIVELAVMQHSRIIGHTGSVGG